MTVGTPDWATLVTGRTHRP